MAMASRPVSKFTSNKPVIQLSGGSGYKPHLKPLQVAQAYHAAVIAVPIWKATDGSLTCAPPVQQVPQVRLVDDYKGDTDGANQAYVSGQGFCIEIFKTCYWREKMSSKLAQYLLRQSANLSMDLDMAPTIKLTGSDELIRLFNPDTLSPTGAERMVGVLVENEVGHNERWKLAAIYSELQIQWQYGIPPNLLPSSPRHWLFEKALKESKGLTAPVGLSHYDARLVVQNINWGKVVLGMLKKQERDNWRRSKSPAFWSRLEESIYAVLCPTPIKEVEPTAEVEEEMEEIEPTQQVEEAMEEVEPTEQVEESAFARAVLLLIMNPAKKDAWLEWRRFLKAGEHQIAFGLRWLNQQSRWKLTGLFDDPRRMYRAHRLVGSLCVAGASYTRYSCEELKGLITTTIEKM